MHLTLLWPVEVGGCRGVADARVHPHRGGSHVRLQVEVTLLEPGTLKDVGVHHGVKSLGGLDHGRVAEPKVVDVLEQPAEHQFVVAEGRHLRVEVLGVLRAGLLAGAFVGDVAGEQRLPHHPRLHGHVLFAHVFVHVAEGHGVRALLSDHLEGVEARANVSLRLLSEGIDGSGVRPEGLFSANVPEALVEPGAGGRDHAEDLGHLPQGSERGGVEVVADADDGSHQRTGSLPLCLLADGVVVRTRVVLVAVPHSAALTAAVYDAQQRLDRAPALGASQSPVYLVDDHQVGPLIADDGLHLNRVGNLGPQSVRASVVRGVHLDDPVPGVLRRDVREGCLTDAGSTREQQNLVHRSPVLV